MFLQRQKPWNISSKKCFKNQTMYYYYYFILITYHNTDSPSADDKGYPERFG